MGSFGLFVAGCEQATQTARLPDPVWPSVRPAPVISGRASIPAPVARVTPPAQPITPVATPGSAANPIDRSKWAHAGPDTSDINPMGGVNRITIHHDGDPFPSTDTSYAYSVARMEHYREAHRQRGWADIGYHYVIDPGGRVWEARDVRYQGAHVKDHNEHNLGVMVMGNYNMQYPTDVQLTALRDAVQYFRRKYNVSQRAIFTHRELGPTSCPGNNMQPKVEWLRSNGQFG